MPTPSSVTLVSTMPSTVLTATVILVPSPNVAEDHQARNAEALVSRKAAIMIPDHLAREQLVDRMLKLIRDENHKEELSKNIKQLGISDASERIAGEVIKIIKR